MANVRSVVVMNGTRRWWTAKRALGGMKQPWRESASVIVAARLSPHEVIAKGQNLASVMERAKRLHGGSPRVDYRLLMVKRSGSSGFLANAFVYPGGLVETADYAARWWSVFERLGVSRRELVQRFVGRTRRPPIVARPLTPRPAEDALPAEVALRITAIRETFEETGILLLTDPSLETTQEATRVDVPSWQRRVHDDPEAFAELCTSHGLCPDLWSLYEWSNWLTPASIGDRRYDTLFFLCCLNRRPEVRLDQGEVTVMRWCTPEEILEANTTGDVFLAPPQVYELCRLLPVQSFHALGHFAKGRESRGCERYAPLVCTAFDGALSLLPGDDMYPKGADDSESLSRPVEFGAPLDDLRTASEHLHRMEMRGPRCTVHCNVAPPCGHLQPLTFRPSHPVLQSFL